MKLFIDAETISRLLSQHKGAFPRLVEETGKGAAKHLGKDIAAAKPALATIRRQYEALGHAEFVVVIDNLTDSAVSSLAKKLDKNNTGLKSALPAGHRKHIIALAAQREEPASPAPKTSSRAKAKPVKEPDFRSPFDNPDLVSKAKPRGR